MEAIVKAVKNGDASQYRVIVETYQNPIYRYILKMTNHKEMAEDLTQEVFVTAYEKIKQYQSKVSFQAWLYKIAKNKTINAIKKQKRVIPMFTEQMENSLIHEDNYNEGFENEAIKSVLKRLKPEEKSLLILKAVDELGYKELSTIYACSEATIRKRYERIRKKFRDIYSEIEGGTLCQKSI